MNRKLIEILLSLVIVLKKFRWKIFGSRAIRVRRHDVHHAPRLVHTRRRV